MLNKKFLTLYLFIIISVVWGYFYYHNEAFPIAFVNWDIISQKDFNDYYRLSFNYLNKTINVYNSESKAMENETTIKEIKAAVLDKLIENSLIYKEAKSKIGKDLEIIANQKIENALKDKNIEEAINTLFESSLTDYIQKELVPQAYKEILQGRMALNNEDFESWLTLAKTNAKILILIPGYSWDEQKISAN